MALEGQPDGDAAGDVCRARHGNPGSRQRRRQAAAFDHAGHVNREKAHMKAADAEARRHAPEPRLAKHVAHGL
jgi:hypothetical protein